MKLSSSGSAVQEHTAVRDLVDTLFIEELACLASYQLLNASYQ